MNVIAAASTDEKLQLCIERGAHGVIDYSTEDLKARVREITDGGADVVVDPVGGDLTPRPRCARCGDDGRLMVIGFASGDIPRLPANQILLRNRSVLGVDWGAWAMANPEANAGAPGRGDGRRSTTASCAPSSRPSTRWPTRAPRCATCWSVGSPARSCLVPAPLMASRAGQPPAATVVRLAAEVGIPATTSRRPRRPVPVGASPASASTSWPNWSIGELAGAPLHDLAVGVDHHEVGEAGQAVGLGRGLGRGRRAGSAGSSSSPASHFDGG